MTAQKINSISAFIAIDEDGDEGIMAWQLPGTNIMLPLIAADEERVKSRYPLALEISQITGRPFRVMQFMVRQDITDDVKKICE